MGMYDDEDFAAPASSPEPESEKLSGSMYDEESWAADRPFGGRTFDEATTRGAEAVKGFVDRAEVFAADPLAGVVDLHDRFVESTAGAVADKAKEIVDGPGEHPPGSLYGPDAETSGDKAVGKAWTKLKGFVSAPWRKAVDAGEDLVEAGQQRGARGVADEVLSAAGPATAATRWLVGDKDAGTIFDEEVARVFGAGSPEEFEKMTGVEAAAGLAVNLGPDGVHPFARKTGAALGRVATAQAPLVVEDAASWWSSKGEENLVSQAAIMNYEWQTGRKWVGPKALAQLRFHDPRQYEKTRSAQMNVLGSFLRGVGNVGKAIGSFAGPAVSLAADIAGRDTEIVGIDGLGAVDVRDVENTWMDWIGSTPLNAETAKHMGSAMVEDPIDTLTDPFTRMMEDPFGTMLDYVSFGTVPVAAIARVRAAKAIAKTDGFVKAAVESAPVPFYKGAGNLAAREAASVLYADVLDTVSRNKWTRSWTEAYPEAKAEHAAAALDARRSKAGSQEVAKDLINNWREALGEKPIKWDSKPKKSEAKRHPEVAKMMDAAVDFDDAVAAARLHENARRVRERLIALDRAPELEARRAIAEIAEQRAAAPDLDAIARGDSLTQIARSPAAQRASRRAQKARARANKLELTRDERLLLEQLNDPRLAMNLAKNKLADEALDVGFHGTRKRLEDLHAEVLPPDAKASKIAARLQEIESLEKRLASLERINTAMYTAEAMRKQGAWLEVNGKQVSGIDATLDVMHQIRSVEDGGLGRKAADVIDDMVIRGDNPVMVGAMQQAKELSKFLAAMDEVELRHGVIDEAQAAAQMGMRFNMMRDPIRAKELVASAGHGATLNPLAAITDTSNRVQHLLLTERLLEQGMGRGNELRVGRPYASRTDIGGEKWATAPVLGGREKLYQVPANIPMQRGLKVEKYGAMVGKWVNFDEAKLMQDVIGTRLSAIESVMSVIPKNRVINNLHSHLNAFVSDNVNMAINGLSPERVLRRGVKLAGGGTSEADKLLSAKLRESGVFVGAAIESIDKAAGLDLGSIADIKAQIRKLGDVPGGEKAFSEWLLGTYGDDVHSVRDPAALMSGYRFLTDNLAGWGGLKQHMFDARDRVFRIGVASEAFERYAKHKHGLSAAELQKPANMKKVLADPVAIQKSLELTSELMFDYGRMPRGPQVFGKSRDGLFVMGQKYGLLPFIAYPLKATNLFAKNMVLQPLKMKAVVEGDQTMWEQLSAKTRGERLLVDRSGFTVFSSDGTTSRDTKSLVPLSTVADASTQLGWITDPVAAAWSNRDRWGQRISDHPEGSRADFTTRALYLALHTVAPPEVVRLTGVGAQRGTLDQLGVTGEVLPDRITGLDPEKKQVMAEFLGSFRFGRDAQAQQKAQRAFDDFQKRQIDIMGAPGKPGMIHRTITAKRAERLMYEAGLELAKSLSTIVTETDAR